MENRLIFFANPAEQSETSVAQNEQKDGLKNTADELANLENLKAKPGGTGEVAKAKAMIEGGKISDKAEDILKKQIDEVKAAVAKRKNKLTPETTKTLDAANAKLKKSVEFQKNRLAGNATADSKMNRLASLDRADEIFGEVKISVNGKNFEWKKGEMDNFRLLPLEGKKEFLAKMEKALLEKPDAILAALEKFSRDSRIPEKWRKYAEDPEASGHTKKHAAEWLLANADAKILQSETVFGFLEKNNLVLEKAGVAKPSLDEIFEKSTSEVNQYIESVKSKIAKVDVEQAEHFENLKITEGAQIKTGEVKNTAAIEKAEAEKTATAEELAPKLQRFTLDQKLAEKAAARERELENSGKNEVATVDEAAGLRARAQSGESVGFGAKMKNIFKFGKKVEAQNDADETSAEKDEPGEKESFAERARREIADETLGNPKTAEAFSRSVGLKNLSKEDAAQFSKLLALEKTDAENVRAKLSPEIKAILERQATDDETKKTT